jgi:hypothetical protein
MENDRKDWIYPLISAIIAIISFSIPTAGNILLKAGSISFEGVWIFGLFISINSANLESSTMYFLTDSEEFLINALTFSSFILIIGLFFFILSFKIKRDGMNKRTEKSLLFLSILLILCISEWFFSSFFHYITNFVLDQNIFGDFWESYKPIGILGLIFSALIIFIGLRRNKLEVHHKNRIYTFVGVIFIISPLFPTASQHDFFAQYVWMFGCLD